MPLLRDILRKSQDQLRQAGLENADLDARLLIEHGLGLPRTVLLTEPDRIVTDQAAKQTQALLDRRLAGEPVARILGEWEFWSLPFLLSADTLIPRPDTEILVEAGLQRSAHDRDMRILDLGTGSGAILLALLSERPLAFGVGIDRSVGAATTARLNAMRLGLAQRAAFVVSDWARALHGRFDLILANPPYIRQAEIAGLMREVRDHDPALALDGGPDGLTAYRCIISQLDGLLAPAGEVIFEIGHDQADDLSAILTAANFKILACLRDLAGHERAVVATASHPATQGK
jgi:release factor glutamine methyltransferase